MLNTHKLQVFSFEEIWQGVLQRLVELKVLRNPDEFAPVGNDSDESEEYTDWHQKIEQIDFKSIVLLQSGKLEQKKKFDFV